MFRGKNYRWEVSMRFLVKRQWTEHWHVYIGVSVELHWSIQVEDLARCPGKQQVSLNGDNVVLFSNSTSDFVWIRSCTPSLSWLQMCLSCPRTQSTRNLWVLCLIFWRACARISWRGSESLGLQKFSVQIKSHYTSSLAAMFYISNQGRSGSDIYCWVAITQR